MQKILFVLHSSIIDYIPLTNLILFLSKSKCMRALILFLIGFYPKFSLFSRYFHYIICASP
ncbi:hypothetical protein C2G38_2099562 [Gigaspora rosea]|uniref:Uncharacterized protein n=1 Tax=Gigaspora rosea TaxID=44941 RepID=A0A397UT39_9GLOM|nr:hypothetical protein C2G38_2099562 [Gigaspora rosea]